ncbi:MAG: isochorismatase family protein [Bdellovibrionota bacterium]
MNRLKFILTSDQHELLLAFENAKGLAHLAELMARDPSVVSRNLQKIAEDYPVLKKVKGRWEITPLGVQINQQTRAYLEQQTKLVSQTVVNKYKKSALCTDDSILIIVNAQNGLLDATQEGRNNSEVEKNIAHILEHWRTKKRRIIHVKHVSGNPESIFYRHSEGSDFLKTVTPKANEVVIEKTKSSAFTDTNLESFLTKESCSNILLVGFTANECIDATARDAAALEFETLVVGDGTATFDLRDQSGKLIKADRIHRLILLNINAFHAKVVNTIDVLN